MSSGRAFCFFGHRDVVNQNHDISKTIATPILSRRQKTTGANHHLWNNHGTWWFHGTEHRPDGTAARIRVSLRTDDIAMARRLRDRILTKHTRIHILTPIKP